MHGRLKTAAVSSVLLAGLTLALPASGDAQTRTLSWNETTQVEVPGALGALLRVTGVVGTTESSSALHLQGSSLIQDSGSTTTLFDLSEGRFLVADHDARSYITMAFGDITAMSQEALESTYSSTNEVVTDPEVEAARRDMAEALEEVEATIEFRVSSEATGQRRRIGEHDAVQHLVISEFEATAVPEGVDEREGGSLVFIAELWQAAGVPTEDAILEEWARQLSQDPAFQEMAREQAASGDATGALAGSMFAWSPEIGAGLLRMSEEIERIDGSTVESVITVAMVPLGATLDRQALLGWEPQSMGGQLRSGAAGVAREAAADAVRGAVGGLAGRFGIGRRGADPEPEAAPAEAPAVQPLFRVTTTRADLSYRESGDDVLGSLQNRIAGYAEQTMDMPRP